MRLPLTNEVLLLVEVYGPERTSKSVNSGARRSRLRWLTVYVTWNGRPTTTCLGACALKTTSSAKADKVMKANTIVIIFLILTTLFLRDVCDLADAASSPGYLARLARGPAGSAPRSLCPSGRRFVLVAVVVALADLVFDPDFVVVLVVAVDLVSDPGSVGSVGFVAAVAAVVATSAST